MVMLRLCSHAVPNHLARSAPPTIARKGFDLFDRGICDNIAEILNLPILAGPLPPFVAPFNAPATPPIASAAVVTVTAAATAAAAAVVDVPSAPPAIRTARLTPFAAINQWHAERKWETSTLLAKM